MEAIDLAEARDRELVLRIRRRDEEAFRGLFGRYAPGAKALAHAGGPTVASGRGDRAGGIHGASGGTRPPTTIERGSVKSWLMGMVHHRAVDLVRREESYRRRAEKTAHQAMELESDHADAVVEQIGLPEERRRVRAALDELPEAQREVLELHVFRWDVAERRSRRPPACRSAPVKSRTLLGMRRMRAVLVQEEP